MKNLNNRIWMTAIVVAFSVFTVGCGAHSTDSSSNTAAAAVTDPFSTATTNTSTATPAPVLPSAIKYPFYITGNNLTASPEVKGCFTNSSGLNNCFQNASSNTAYGVKNKSGSATSIASSTDTRLIIRASANASAGLTVAGYNASFVNNSCLQFTISVNGYPVQTRLLSRTGATTCTTYNYNTNGILVPSTIPAQAYDDIDFTNCLGNSNIGALTVEVSDAQYEYRCNVQGIGTSCPIGPVYQTHIVSGNLWIETDATQLPTITGGTTVRACDSL